MLWIFVGNGGAAVVMSVALRQCPARGLFTVVLALRERVARLVVETLALRSRRES